MKDFLQIKSEVDSLNRRFEAYRRYMSELEALGSDYTLYTDAKHLIDLCNEEQAKLSKFVSNIVTELLQWVFGPHYEFKLEDHKVKGMVTGQRPVIYEGGKELRQGGGVRNVASIGIRLAFLVLKPELAPVLVMDEYMNNLKGENYARVIDFITDYQKKEPLQVIYISHVNFESPGKIVGIEKRKGVSRKI